MKMRKRLITIATNLIVVASHLVRDEAYLRQVNLENDGLQKLQRATWNDKITEESIEFKQQKKESRILPENSHNPELRVSEGDEITNNYPDLSTFAARKELLDYVKNSCEAPLSAKGDDGGYSGFTVDPNEKTKYVNGGNRRPTDPATHEEVISAQTLLFGVSSCESLEECDLLKIAWAPANDGPLAAIGGIDPSSISDVSRISAEPGDPSNGLAQDAFIQYADNDGFPSAYSWLQEPAQAKYRRAIRWWSTGQITTAAPTREEVYGVEEKISAGESFELHRILHVRVSGGLREVTDGGKIWWGSVVHVAVDVTDLSSPFVVPERTEVYSYQRRDSNKTPSKKIDDLDQMYLKTAAMSLYGEISNGARQFVVTYNGDLNNQSGGFGNDHRSWSAPFEYVDGDDAELIGFEKEEYLYLAHLAEYSPSAVPVDGHQTSTGVLLYPVPLTMAYGVYSDGSVSPPLSHNALIDSKVGALTWYGRGLTFSNATAHLLKTSINMTNIFESDFDMIAVIMSNAIKNAWGDEETSVDSNFRPGQLKNRGDGIAIPAVILKHSYDTPTYVNHATSSVLEGKFLDGAPHRDARDNLDYMAPPEVNGKPKYEPNGKPREVVEVLGRSFEVDGYAVTYKAGITWKFLMGFDADAGLTLYHVRQVLPPSRAYPDGKEIPFIFRTNIPEFGTDYSTSKLGNQHSWNFYESHYRDGTSFSKEATCSGTSLPLFRSKSGAYISSAAERLVFYGTYGLGIMDPYSAYLGVEAELNAFPNTRQFVDNGIIAYAICLEEMDLGHSMWHLITSQHLRALAISMSTISNAYNVVVRYTLLSDGKMKVGAHAHGKPGFTMPGVPGVSGEYGSKSRGGFASNHIHWHVIAVEPALKMNEVGVLNKLQVIDKVAPGEDDTDLFGTAFHRSRKTILNVNETDKLSYDFVKQRYWRIQALDGNTGEDIGGLKISSQRFSPPIQAGKTNPNVSLNETYYGNHWWLRQDVHIVNATGRRDAMVLRTNSVDPGYNSRQAIEHPFIGNGTYGDPVIFFTLKLEHNVIEEELPVQGGFTDIEITITPENMYGFNPQILVRYDPVHNDVIENTWTQSYTAPYSGEYADIPDEETSSL